MRKRKKSMKKRTNSKKMQKKRWTMSHQYLSTQEVGQLLGQQLKMVPL
jgi:hypothetical protein